MIINKFLYALFAFLMLVTGLLFTVNAFANIKLPAIFSDNIVLQQKSNQRSILNISTSSN
jgi:hypothetical protein